MDADVLLGQEEDEEAMNAAMAASTAGSAMAAAAREYRRGNWTLPETMLLVEAKKRVSDGRRPAADQGLARWRWVEDYCWRRGCRRSQNQCNDRWDNLMRDYKKVRAHELAGGGGGPAESYWVMGRTERKEKGLPANLLREIYDAMGEVVERRPMSSGGGGGGAVFLAGASSSGSGGLADVPAMAMQASPLAQLLPRPLGDGELQLGVAGEEEEAALAGSMLALAAKRRGPAAPK
uniref:Myb-like domain-containing protein n=1 Tax=Oryza barthii TaxID=65489 RepID=A0A0D3FM56_9ORYZ